jgi:hypothetical protein
MSNLLNDAGLDPVRPPRSASAANNPLRFIDVAKKGPPAPGGYNLGISARTPGAFGFAIHGHHNRDMSLKDFGNAALDNLRGGMKTVYFTKLCGALDEYYRGAIRALHPNDTPLFFGRTLLICDKAFRSGACLIASCQPEDSVAITRRAIEAAKTALAVKLNVGNVQNWLAEHERIERWAARLSNEKPKFFKVELEGIKGDPLIADLDKFLGILSDAYVHFTPEFYSALAWRKEGNAEGTGGRMYLNYFHTHDREIERHYLMLSAIHAVILNAFDRCADGRITRNGECSKSINRFWAIQRNLSDVFEKRYAEAPVP